jgi:hypothetical protein
VSEVLVVSEHDALGGVEVHRGDVEVAARVATQATEVVRQPVGLEVVPQIGLDLRVVEET